MDAVIAQVLAMLKTKSRRAVARKTGISRGTVNAIAAGKRTIRGDSRSPRSGNLFGTFEVLARRCRCGRRVFMPRGKQICLACRVEAAMPRPSADGDNGDALALNLPGDRATVDRYRQCRRQAERRRQLAIEPKPGE